MRWATVHVTAPWAMSGGSSSASRRVGTTRRGRRRRLAGPRVSTGSGGKPPMSHERLRRASLAPAGRPRVHRGFAVRGRTAKPPAMRITCEVCVESVAGARAAAAGGADRIELCSALVEGGLTPSVGLLARTRAVCRLTTMVMLRPRGGDFCYSDDEVEQMRIDREVLREHGADGFVLGFLEPDGSIDERRTRAFVAAAAPLPVTFHRAFDWTPHPFAALERLIDCGVK